jgi:Ca2+-binding EF-hand superfamily protein
MFYLVLYTDASRLILPLVFAHNRDNNIKPESIKKAYKRFQATDKDSTGMIDYTEFCEVLKSHLHLLHTTVKERLLTLRTQTLCSMSTCTT